MKTPLAILLAIIMLTATGCSADQTEPPKTATASDKSTNTTIKLPEPTLRGTVSLEEALFERRSVREYSEVALSLEEVSQLLWSAQGITESWGGRTAPSAGGLYPLEVYLVTGNVNNLAAGVYKYLPAGHELVRIKEQDLRAELAAAVLNQTWVREGAIDIVIAAVYERTTQKYGERGIRYVHMEVGHAAQNICLQAVVLDLGAVTVGAFDDSRVQDLLGMPRDEAPLYVIPVGKRE